MAPSRRIPALLVFLSALSTFATLVVLGEALPFPSNDFSVANESGETLWLTLLSSGKDGQPTPMIGILASRDPLGWTRYDFRVDDGQQLDLERHYDEHVSAILVRTADGELRVIKDLRLDDLRFVVPKRRALDPADAYFQSQYVVAGHMQTLRHRVTGGIAVALVASVACLTVSGIVLHRRVLQSPASRYAP